MDFLDYRPNQARVYIDARQAFAAYREAQSLMQQYRGGMTWKTVNGADYLIKVINRSGGTKSLGRRSPETEKIHADFTARKTAVSERLRGLRQSVKEFGGMARAVGINRVPAVVSLTLNKLDEAGLLGRNLIVVGTNALYAYEAAAGVMFDPGLMGTTDVDLLWDARARLKLASVDSDVAAGGVLALLKKVDASFERVKEGGFRAVNKDGFLVDLLKQAPRPPWKRGEPERIAQANLTPSWLPKIQWLLSSEKFESMVVGQDGTLARMVSPDPRAFAVYKAWLSEQEDRDPIKAKRDIAQARATIALVQEKFPHLTLDENAQRMFPREFRNPPAVRAQDI